ncbi:M56 family metallopeptidase [Robertkochia solimangrovi]|uniref:M56 family metallopeptidase n=1 Tax=Robertkochia solimangrovi TaxID=2213046 RepID=UPI00117D473E|nr:M56 family metallopeptidase [Robertkochia solimangrovi]TRZ46353.1 hypothetical protein DMZ48_03615 [Robertkochia solimangrovi]
MLQYLIESISFQLLFLLVYDLFLKKETFFNWNRTYLIITPLLAMVLPLIRLEILKTTVPQELAGNIPVILLGEAAPPVVLAEQAVEPVVTLNLWEWIGVCGAIIAFFLFLFKLLQIIRLRRSGELHRYAEYLQIEVRDSEVAFSFFRQIFLGKRLVEREHDHIIAHELVHIRERHSWDLIYFEIFRILMWFNPLIYVYQARITELHEYIADSITAKDHRDETYQNLLEQVFQTQKISFINAFFNHSLIKKRIVMLNKDRSSTIKKFKYLLMAPLMLGILLYTSCEREVDTVVGVEEQLTNPTLDKYYKEYKSRIDKGEEANVIYSEILELTPVGEVSTEEAYYRSSAYFLLRQEHFNETVGLSDGLNKEISAIATRTYEDYLAWTKTEEGQMQLKLRSMPYFSFDSNGNLTAGSGGDVPFTTIAVKPSFKTDCGEGMSDFDCFKEQLDAHVRSTFKYPVEAQEAGAQGRVYVNFRINTDGSVTILNTRAPDESLDQEARRIIEALPSFNPGSDVEGKLYPVTFAYPIVFKLSGGVAGTSDKTIPLTVVAEKPSFPGACDDGLSAIDCFKSNLDKHVIKNFRYPKEAQEQGIQGRVYVQFQIKPDGSIALEKMRSPSTLLSEEVRRIMNALPKMNPGRDADGNAVAVSYAYPVVFKLNTNKGDSADLDGEPILVGYNKDGSKITVPNQHGMGAEISERNGIPKGVIGGNIKDLEGKGLPGVNITIEGQNSGVVTDFDGNFRISAKVGDIVVFQHLDHGTYKMDLSEIFKYDNYMDIRM